ncbi:MAG: YdcF family protein [Thermodesulfobacteriota bacterium]
MYNANASHTHSAGPCTIVVMGAAVWEGGRPSKAMERRVSAAVDAANTMKNPQHPEIIVTGGVGKHPPSEADVMRHLLVSNGVPDDYVICERKSTSTLESIINCSAIIKAKKLPTPVMVVSDRYHQLRCSFLFQLLGIKAFAGYVPSGLPSTGLLRWLFMYTREIPAILFDSLLLLIRRPRLERSGC